MQNDPELRGVTISDRTIRLQMLPPNPNNRAAWNYNGHVNVKI